MCVMIVSAVLLSNMHAGGVHWHVNIANGGFVPGPKTFTSGVRLCCKLEHGVHARHLLLRCTQEKTNLHVMRQA